MSVLESKEPGKKVLTTGDKAAARGALEAGVGYFATYPGTPASGVGDSLYRVKDKLNGFHFEYSINEKVAFEGAIGAALVGIRSMVAMKHLGLNVAADPMHHLTNRLIINNFVILNGSDPGMQASATEQDNRFYSLNTHIPVLQPSNTQELKDFTIEAFEISKNFNLPVIIDAPSLLLHGLGEVILGDLPDQYPSSGKYQRIFADEENEALGRVGNHLYLLKRRDEVAEYSEHSRINQHIAGEQEWGIVTSGVAFGYVLEAFELLGISDVPILKLGMVYPISKNQILSFAKTVEKVLIAEEGEGFIEYLVKNIAYDAGLHIPILGKELFSQIGMLSASRITIDLAKHFGLEIPKPFSSLPNKFIEQSERIGTALALPGGESIEFPGFSKAPKRMRTFCTGCPHRGTAYAIKKATKGKALVGGDIGCYNISSLPPYKLYNWHLCMGAGIGIGHGVAQKVNDQPVIAMIGDSTFFHSGLPATLNAVINNTNILLIIMDNSWVAMTGHQPSPSSKKDLTGEAISNVDIELTLKGLGVPWVRKANPFKPNQLKKLIKTALVVDGVKAILVEGECMIQSQRRKRLLKEGRNILFRIDQEQCKQCGTCFFNFGCTAISTDEQAQNFSIQETTCTGCGACVDVCPAQAIVPVKTEES